jgi:hypothetical protein
VRAPPLALPSSSSVVKPQRTDTTTLRVNLFDFFKLSDLRSGCKGAPAGASIIIIGGEVVVAAAGRGDELVGDKVDGQRVVVGELRVEQVCRWGGRGESVTLERRW